jgi:5-methylcytosine-specific restriction endonuclease McrA
MSRCTPFDLVELLFPTTPDPDTPGKYLCRYCGRKIEGNRKKYYCSNTCYNNYYRATYWPWVRQEVLERDNFTCQVCGTKVDDSWKAEVHHIVSVADFWDISWKLVKEWGLPEERTKEWAKTYTLLYLDTNNLITLCVECHDKVHAGIITLEGEPTITEKWWLPSLDQWLVVTE